MSYSPPGTMAIAKKANETTPTPPGRELPRELTLTGKRDSWIGDCY